MSSKPLNRPFTAYVKGKSWEGLVQSVQVAVWPDGGAVVEVSELNDRGYWHTKEKFRTTRSNLFMFWKYLGGALSVGNDVVVTEEDVEGLPLDSFMGASPG